MESNGQILVVANASNAHPREGNASKSRGSLTDQSGVGNWLRGTVPE